MSFSGLAKFTFSIPLVVGSLFSACGQKSIYSTQQQKIVSVKSPEKAVAAQSSTKPMPDVSLEFERSQSEAVLNFADGATFQSSNAVVFWRGKPQLLKSVREPTRSRFEAVPEVPKVDCDADSKAVPSALVLWCLKGNEKVLLTEFNAATNLASEKEFKIPKSASADTPLKILGTDAQWLLMARKSQIVGLIRTTLTSVESYVVAAPKKVDDVKLSKCLGGLRLLSPSSKTPLVWIQCENTVYTHNFENTKDLIWTEQKLIFNGLDDAVGKSASFLLYPLKELNGTVQWGGALFQHDKLYLTKGLLDAELVATPAPLGTVGPQPDQEDAYWLGKGKQIVSKYCTGCHTHPFGQNPPDRDGFRALKDEILRRTALQGNQSGVMPPYGSPRVPAADLTELRNWLNRNP